MTSILNGIDMDRLSLLSQAIETDIQNEKCDGAVVLVARRGEIVLHEAFGFADRAAGAKMRKDSVFFTFSILDRKSVV
jgi:CubicO group peptidase (beta-lactamase class C family)